MTALLSIGEFSRLTHVSVKALRHYHDQDLLRPAQVDPDSGYRLYATAQAATAQLIRRFRDLSMPLDQIKAVLSAADPTERESVIAGHLRSMERQLDQTKRAVTSLRKLLEAGGLPFSDVEFRTVAGTPALLVSERVAWDEAFVWLRDTLTDLRREVGADTDLRDGPDGALYSAEFFESHIGEATAFIPLRASAGGSGVGLLPAGPMAVATHRGSFSELDRTYTALGTFVAERDLRSRTRTAIRENYLVSLFNTDHEDGLVTEVCWPVSR